MPHPLPSDLGLYHIPSFREGQLDTIYNISCTNKRFRTLHASTGSGKTVINIGAANLLGSRMLYLTHSKSLQDQLDSYGLSAPYDIRGHNNYQCAASISVADPNHFDDIFECKWSRDSCIYNSKCKEASNSRLVKTNYSHWITLAKNDATSRLGDFDILIMDEAHLAHDILVDHLTVTIKEIDCRLHLRMRLPDHTTPLDEWIDWLIEALAKLSTINLSQEDKRSRSTIAKMSRDFKFLLDLNKSDFVIQTIGTDITFTPIWGKHFTEQYLFCNIPIIILCSGTITPEDLPELGISINETEWIEVDSTFDPSLGPFIFSPSDPELYVDHRLRNDSSKINLWVAKQDQLICDRLDRKGIIHSWAYEWSRIFARESRFANDPNFTMISHRQNSDETKRAIKQFLSSSPPSLLNSPSVKEGHDFTGDYCRYQILPKIPYIFARDPVIAARIKTDSTYSLRRTCRNIEQMAGRGRRSKSDWCETICTDSYWRKISKIENRKYFSSWFVKSWREGRRPVPPPLAR